LWIVKSIIDRHAGTIALVRTDTGRTRFTLSLPRELSE
jgi:signal transduction histidine kinase